MKNKLKIKVNNQTIINILKGSILAVSFSLICILVFALIIKLTNIPNSFIAPINQVIKILSIFFGCHLTLKNFREKGLLTGASIGAVYTILAFLIFSLLNQSFTFSYTILVDILFAIIIGSICGIFVVNKKIKVNN